MSDCEVHTCKAGFYFTKEEQETILTTDALAGEWNLYTRQSKIMTKMKKLGIEPYKVYVCDGEVVEAEYKLSFSQVSFRHEKEKRVYTEEEKEKMRKVLLQNRNKLKKSR